MGGTIMKARVKAEHKEERSNRVRQFFANIRTWHLILILIPLLFATATFLRFDHLKMSELRQAVIDADIAGEEEKDDGTVIESKLSQEEITANIEKAIKELKDFTSTHTIVNFTEKNGDFGISFGTGPIYLEHQYNRQARALMKAAEANLSTPGANGMLNEHGDIFAAAMEVCRAGAYANGYYWYVNCMNAEISKYPSASPLVSTIIAEIPNTALYRHDFASPIWTPTAAGWFALICLILIVIIIIRLISWIIIRTALLIVH